MLALTRRIGQTLRIGDDIRVTVRSRLRDLVLIDVSAPAGSHLYCEGMPQSGTHGGSGRERYLVPVMTGECLQLGAVRIAIDGDRRCHGGQIRLHVDAPRQIAVTREELVGSPRRLRIAA